MRTHRKTLAKGTQMLGVAALALAFTAVSIPSYVYAITHSHQVNQASAATLKHTSSSSLSIVRGPHYPPPHYPPPHYPPPHYPPPHYPPPHYPPPHYPPPHYPPPHYPPPYWGPGPHGH